MFKHFQPMKEVISNKDFKMRKLFLCKSKVFFCSKEEKNSIKMNFTFISFSSLKLKIYNHTDLKFI